MNAEEQSTLVAYWWDKLQLLRRKFVRETHLGGLDQDDLEQECFIQLQKALERYRPEMGVPFECYYKVVLRGWRANQNRVRARMELALGEDDLFLIEDERVHIEQDVELKMLLEEVESKINELEEEERKIIVAYYLEDRKLADIASMLGRTYKSVEHRKNIALKKLRNILS